MKAIAFAITLALAVMPVAPAGAQDAQLRVHAAGSLRAPLTALAAEYERTKGTRIALTFGASGLLRDRIAGGEAADVFASANMEHPESLVKSGWSAKVVPFARNQLCALVRPQVPLTTDNALAVLLDPQWKLGTSTPKADPSGDYARELFRRADAVKPGSYAALSARALQLTGGPTSPPPPADRNVYGVLAANGDADIFLTYCTSTQQAVSEHPTLRSVRMPDTLRVGAVYGIASRRDAPEAAAAFVAFVLGPDGQRTLGRFGFDPP